MGKIIDNLRGSPCSVAGYMASKNICVNSKNCIKELHPEDKYACWGCIMNFLSQEEEEQNVYQATNF